MLTDTLSGIRIPRRTVHAVFACYLIVNFHLLRNLTGAYILLLALSYVVALYFTSEVKPGKFGLVAFAYTVFFVFSAQAFFHTIFIYGWGEALYGLGRFWFTIPLAFIVSRGMPFGSEIRRLLWLFVAIVVFGILSILLQYATGPISWFPEPGGRAGMARYGSFLGSIPTIGSVIPIAFYCTAVLDSGIVRRVLVNLLLLTGLLLALSKEAIAGTALAFLLSLVTVKRGRLVSLAGLVASLGLALAGVRLIGEDVGPFIRYVIAIAVPSVEDAQGARGGDSDLSSSAGDRLGSLPEQTLGWLVEQEGENGYVLGGGFGLVGSALLHPDTSSYFTAHNQYVDMLVIGGVGLLLSFAFLLFYGMYVLHRLVVFCRQTRNRDEDVAVALRGILLLISVLCLFGGGFTFQPALSAIWWILIGVAWRFESSRFGQVHAIPVRLSRGRAA